MGGAPRAAATGQEWATERAVTAGGYGVTMDAVTATLVFTVAAWLLGAIISLLVLYLVVRSAVSHALRSHHYWLEENTTRR